MRLRHDPSLFRRVAAAHDFGRVAVLHGGSSTEREISLLSGAAVLEALERRSGQTICRTAVVPCGWGPCRWHDWRPKKVPDPRDATNARYLPSGLQRGDDSLSGDEVSWSCSLPSHFTIHTSVLRLSVSALMVVTVYATQVPSGERCGSPTDTRRE